MGREVREEMRREVREEVREEERREARRLVWRGVRGEEGVESAVDQAHNHTNKTVKLGPFEVHLRLP